MGDYECRGYQGWSRHMLFVMITHVFAAQIRETFKKAISLKKPMLIKLMHGIIVYTVTDMKK